jgi:hypothetical protein
MELGKYIMPAESISTAHFINLFISNINITTIQIADVKP